MRHPERAVVALVRLTSSDVLETQTFPLSDVDWPAIGALTSRAPAEVGIEASRTNYIIAQRGHDEGRPVRVLLYVGSPRRSGSVEADASGQVLQARKL